MIVKSYLTPSERRLVTCTGKDLVMSPEAKSFAKALDDAFGIKEIVIGEKRWLHPRNKQKKYASGS